MKELVTILIPLSDKDLTPFQKKNLASCQAHLGDFQITFIKADCNECVAEVLEICPKADFFSVDDRYFTASQGLAKFLLSEELYDMFSWSRFLLWFDMNSYVHRNELAYWCRQGYDLIQLYPAFDTNLTQMDQWRRIINPGKSILLEKEIYRSFQHSAGFSLRRVDVFQKLVRKKKSLIFSFFQEMSGIDSANDSLFLEYYLNRWRTDLAIPNQISRNRFVHLDHLLMQEEMPFASISPII
ncbi:DUF5672 family protein [Arundinibacter roseus]|uniref:DUF5672 domain-containing protein n=1 Tax=Arundinibacter roseus TaxID=2070510 RepID=A0A4R4KDN6_9BACT|nr:DUF5672 family protein [Arundinibacter roseus]TDB64489.1 hypothetical protein EZE20_12490 [Arundinibacter roseus]